MHSFPDIRIGMMVGIGGGAPSQKHDIRLGDVVVSVPGDRKGGVFQYDFGKTIQDQKFKPTGILNQPPAALLTAVAAIRGQYEIHGHNIEENINLIVQKHPRLQKKYSRPDTRTDRLYQSHAVHPARGDSSCAIACGTDPSLLIPRAERTQYEDNPAIHYGVIASANQLMKDALLRDRLSTEEDICFEMEAAGLMNLFPCIVIRGICDYADSHKNKEWQGYAAMTAAAYAKDLLGQIAPKRIEKERKIGDILSGLHEVAGQQLNIAKEQLQIQKAQMKQMLSKEEQECHQLFRLTTSSTDATYEWYKDRVEDRVEDTCLWFLRHEHFQRWLEQDSGPLLVTADPGCGKSVLAKYLIDHARHSAVVKVLHEAGGTVDCKYLVPYEEEHHLSRGDGRYSLRQGRPMRHISHQISPGSVARSYICGERERTPLSRAAEEGHETLVKFLIETGKVDVDWRDQRSWTPLSWAVEGGHWAVVKLL